jgi:hypothetical protein
MPKVTVKKPYGVRTKQEFVGVIKNSSSISEALKSLRCNRKSLMKYFDTYNIKMPNNWKIENKLVRTYVRSAIKDSHSYKMEDIMYVLGKIIPEELQYRIFYNQVRDIKNMFEKKMVI